MKKLKAIIACLITAVFIMAIVGCSDSSGSNAANDPVAVSASDVSYTDEIIMKDEIRELDYDSQSEAVYNEVFGEYRAYYDKADSETDLDMRMVGMALAEAKLLETAAVLPVNCVNFNHRLDRVVPYTNTSGYQNALVTTELIKRDDIEAICSLYFEKRNSDEFQNAVKDYLKEHGYRLKNNCNVGVESQSTITFESWDVFNKSNGVSYYSVEHPLSHTYSGLYTYDSKNNLCPALAESYEVSSDGLTYTFRLRSGIPWVDSNGKKLRDINADDFAAALQHYLDNDHDASYLKGADEYGESKTDFSSVGVRAIDELTLEYTLTKPDISFVTKLDSIPFVPLCRDYYEANGGTFGSDFNAEDENYVYGKDYQHIAYCGSYIISQYKPGESIALKANGNSWNSEAPTVSKLTFNLITAYMDVFDGKVDGLSFYGTTSMINNSSPDIRDYHFFQPVNFSKNVICFNLNRNTFSNSGSNGKMVSPISGDDITRSNLAMRNVHFRRAVAQSIDRITYHEVIAGDNMKTAGIVNSLTPSSHFFISNDVTVDINGTPVKFAAGTDYCEIVQKQLDADSVEISVWNKDKNGVGKSYGFDGWYNPTSAINELNTAIDELKLKGVDITADNPIQIDLPYVGGMENLETKLGEKRAKLLKKSIEDSLNGMVRVNLICADDLETLIGTAPTDSGSECNFSISPFFVNGDSNYHDPGEAVSFSEDNSFICFGIY